jgi:hypothetical protein
MARTRTTKKLAQRIDLNYFKRPTPYKRAKLWLSVLVPLLAVGWIAWRGISSDSRVYSNGRMSEPHAVLEKHCAVCHLQKAGEFSSKAADAACLACHDGPIHHENEIKVAVPACATCHGEHRGRIDIKAANPPSCAECHGNLRTESGPATYAAHVETLENGHPEFAILRAGTKDPGTIQLNHAIHMKPIRRGPNGPIVQLDCDDCHRPAGMNREWPYGDKAYILAATSYFRNLSEVLPRSALWGPKPLAGRETMMPPQFATACAACHLLTFDKRFDVGVPHDKPEVVHAFLIKEFRAYIATHPNEVHVVRDPNRNLTGKPQQAEVRILTPAQWAAERTSDAEELLWRKTCRQCHVLDETPVNSAVTRIPNSIEAQQEMANSLPKVAEARITQRWFPHAKFDHDAHRGFSCAGCHPKALTSKETSDVLVPGIENCKTCHAPGPEHAESRCFECHTYHDWSKRKEVKPTFTLPGLQTGGR